MLDARAEDSARYFFPVRDVGTVETGRRSYVIGRKGAGKTAVAEHIRAMKGPNTFIQSLSFGNFPFNALYKLRDEQFTSASQYTSIWKYLIYTAVCSKMASNPLVDPLVTKDLRRYFNIDLEHALKDSLARLTDRQAGVNFMGTGLTGTLKSVLTPNDTPWPQRVQALEDIVVRHNHPTSRYFIIFDELDEDYRDIRDEARSEQYFDLLYGLFKAISDVRRTLGERHRVYPIAFLRDDIYAKFRDSDRNKWRDFALDLAWDEVSLERLLAHRISRAIAPAGPVLEPDAALSQVFTTLSVRNPGGNTRRRLISHIVSRTLMRPRDIISWVREAANAADAADKDRVASDMLVAIDYAYSQRLQDEFVDEIHSTVPEIGDAFAALSRVRKQVFSFREFADAYAEVARPAENTLSVPELCEQLFNFSVIGNQLRQTNSPVFRYQRPTARINPAEKGVVHPGLMKALQIV